MTEKEPPDKKDEEEKEPVDVDLRHTFNYVGGAFAYKNSKNIKITLCKNCFFSFRSNNIMSLSSLKNIVFQV
jgi:hypothetical protein